MSWAPVTLLLTLSASAAFAQGQAASGDSIELSGLRRRGRDEIVNRLRDPDIAHDSFSLNAAELAVEKKPAAGGRVGFRVDVDYGSGATIVAAADGARAAKRLQQAYVSYLAGTPARGVQIDAGKFLTMAGNEVPETQDNWNYSHSLLFVFAMPADHAGVRASTVKGGAICPTRCSRTV